MKKEIELINKIKNVRNALIEHDRYRNYRYINELNDVINVLESDLKS